MARQLTATILYILLAILGTYSHVSAQVKVPDGFTASIFATGVTNADGLSFDLEGNLYSTNETGNRAGGIFRIDPDGILTPFVTGLSRADGIVFDTATGFMYVAEEVVPGRVSIIDSVGNVSVIFTTPEGSTKYNSLSSSP